MNTLPICGLLKVSTKGSEVLLLLFASCTCSVERIYGRDFPKTKNEVGNHPSHDATLTADLHVAKTLDIAVSFTHVVRREALLFLK